MGLFGDIFKTLTAPARFVAKSPLGDIAKMAAPVVMGPAGIGVSAGIGALEKTDEGLDDMLMGGVESGAQGAASYGMGKGVGALIGKYGGGAAAGGIPDAPAPIAMPAPPTGVVPNAPAPIAMPAAPTPGAGPAPAPVVPSPGNVLPANAPPDPGVTPPPGGGGEDGGGFMDGLFNKLGMGEMPPWLKWSMLLEGASKAGQLGYGIYDNERARGRADNYADALIAGYGNRRSPRGGSYGAYNR